jgi:predicted enzyme related to lactoylglutathione lyase
MHKSRLGTIVIDCQTQDLDAAASFWSAALGRTAKTLQSPGSGNYRGLEGPPEEVTILVQTVQHPSRVHVDIETDDIEAEVLRLESLGAKRVAQVKSWWVMERPQASASASCFHSVRTSKCTPMPGLLRVASEGSAGGVAEPRTGHSLAHNGHFGAGSGPR